MWWLIVAQLLVAIVVTDVENYEHCSIPFLNVSVVDCSARLDRYGENAIIEVYAASTTMCKAGNVLPLLRGENMWNQYFRAVVYFFVLSYLFLGIAIIADIFMSAIEVITSKSKSITYVDDEGHRHESTMLVWNETVANLTLMALGSSAPEILLAVSETITTLGKPPSEDGLGAATIVGSAAFNLLVISALCILAIPDGEVRRIKGTGVFATTSFFSVFAYVWIYFVLVMNSPDVVELWEALMTLLMFPILVSISYIIDAKPCASLVSVIPSSSSGRKKGAAPSKKNFFYSYIKKNKDNADMDPAALAAALTQMAYDDQKKSRLHYRINAVRILKGGKRIIPTAKEIDPSSVKDPVRRRAVSIKQDALMSLISLSSKEYEVFDEDGLVTIILERTGFLDGEAVVEYETGNGTAKAAQHYKYTADIAKFLPGQSTVRFNIRILPNHEEHRPVLTFMIRLQNYGKDTMPGQISTATIRIVSHDSPGIFAFHKACMNTTESVGVLKLIVDRVGGTSGAAKLRWTARSDHLDLKSRQKALPGSDYYPDSGEIDFEHGEKQKTVDIHIVDDDQCESDEKFEVQIYPAEGWADKVKLGSCNKCMVTILDDDEITNMVETVCALFDVNMDKLHVSTSSWTSQFIEAMQVMGEEDSNPSAIDYVMHAVTFFWKVLFAFVPPTSMFGGWLTFFVALAFIGLLTVIIGDAAAIFGCTLGCPDAVTAITFVALGTSLPDTFASMTAARQDEYADASIGNITGSNSVNVFLGLGLPWTIAAIWYGQKDQEYIFYGGSLGFSVGVFCCFALIGLTLLVVRRHPLLANGELGGPRRLKLISAALMTLLWLLYVLLSSLRSMGYI